MTSSPGYAYAFASCGKRFQPDAVRARPGWDAVPAVARDQLYEVKSPLILQPGPAALTDGLDALVAIVDRWRAGVGG